MSLLSRNHSALSQETHSTHSVEATSESMMPSACEESVSEILSSKSGMESYLLVSEFPEEEEEDPWRNPFTVPPDIDIFSTRNKERKKAKAEREKMKTMKIHEKITYSVKIKAKHKGLRKALQEEEEEENSKQATDEERLKALQECLSWKMAIKKDYPLEKETFSDYINDRREIFLLEYAIAVKREEIQKMENTAKKEERRLEKAEYSLEKDAAIFEEFLKESHKSSVQALKIAEKESSAKTKKITEIQAIASQIMNLQSDISRFENTLQEYKVYKDFLYQLSPKDWQEEYKKKRAKQLKTASKANKESTSPLTTAEKGQGLIDGTNAASTSGTDTPTTLLTEESLDLMLSFDTKTQTRSLLKPLAAKTPNPSQDQESKTSSDEDEDPELYFTDPQQLLSLFADMEEQNFSYMQHSQELEKKINEFQHSLIATQLRKEQERAQSKQALLTLKSTVAKWEERAADLKLRVEEFSGEHQADVQDKMLTSLKKKVLEVYSLCTGETKTDLGTVEMLAVIEKKLSNLLDNLERIPPAKIAEIDKARKKERRVRLREEKQRQQQLLQEERVQRALERSQAIVKKKTGRKLMFRSSPPTKKEKKRHDQEQRDKEKEELLYYFT